MKEKNILSCFQKGFRLGFKSIDLLVLSLLVSAPIYLSVTLPWSLFLLMPTIVLFTFLASGFTYALPFFLVERQQNNHLKWKELVKAYLTALDRLLLPVVIYSAIVLFLIFIVVIAVKLATYPSNDQILEFSKNINFYLALSAILGSLFQFNAIYFSLENRGFFDSMWRSIKASIKNLGFIAVVFVISLTSSYINLYVFEKPPLDKFFWIIPIALSFFLTSSALYYYQEVLKKN